jgi:hypothetical protein
VSCYYRGVRRLASAIWSVAFVVVVAAFFAGLILCDSLYVYDEAARRWWAREAVYDLTTIYGYVYLPQTAIFFTPFAKLGRPMGDILWRAAGWGGYAVGVWRLARVLAPRRVDGVFLIATCLALVPSASSLANAQATLHLAALMMHATVEMIGRRWSRATLWLTLGLVIKPLMAAWILLAFALYPPMRWRLMAALAVFVAAPFAFGPPSYVAAQYHDCAAKLRMADAPMPIFENVRGLAFRAGWLMPRPFFLGLRIFAAAATLATGWLARRRLREPSASWFALLFVAIYLMLFNPRTQASTYVMVAGLAGLAGALAFVEGRTREALAIVAIEACWCVSSRGPKLAEFWLKPLACVVFCGLCARALCHRLSMEAPS